ncbi:MAG: PP2C family protein-serine/threonine phosphatase [Acidobacteriota bacterium]
MSLRTRLIVAFFTLSVVPLAAVTFYAYTSNARALREAAEHEADLLAGELGQRMQLVTAQLSERVEHVMNIAELQSQVERASAKAAAPAPPPAVTGATIGTTVANALGEVAMLLNNVELQGMQWAGGRDARPPAQGTGSSRSNRSGTSREWQGPRQPEAQWQGPAQGRGQAQGSRQDRRPPGSPPPPVPAQPPTPAPNPPATTAVVPVPPPAPVGATPPAQPPPAVGRAGAPPAVPAAPETPKDPAAVTRIVTGADIKDRIKIDMAPIRRELLREILPPGKQPGTLTAEERERLGREMAQRMMGIVAGLQLGAAELKKQADAAAKQADAAKVAGVKGTHDVLAAQGRSKAATTAAEKQAMGQPLPRPVTMKKVASLSGNRLDVKFEHEGQVVQQANAEINFTNVLATVFSTTRRDRGEVPFAIGRDGQIYTPTEEERRKVESFGAVARPNGPATARLDDWVVVTTEDPSGSNLRLGIARPVGDSLGTLRRTAARNAGLGALFIAIALAGIVPLSTRLTRNLSALGDGVRRIAQGDYAARVPVRSGDEVGALAQAFNQMAQDIEKHQRAALGQERIKRELELGRQIQHDMLPHAPLKLGLTEIKGVSVPAREVGGDFFNYFETPGGQIALLVGDVSGKGVGAALLMANIQASLRTRLALGQDLSALARELDDDIEANSPGPVYATLFVGLLDPATRLLRYVNAGHHPQYVLHQQRPLDRMTSTGLPIGMFAGHGFREQQIQLAPGDVLFFYTDGCVEAENEVGEMFGADRLESLLVSAASATDDVLARVEGAVNSFRGAQEPFDDATMMSVRVG